MKISTVVLWGVLSASLLVTTIVLAFQGDWVPAVWFAIMWHGMTNNANATLITRAIQPDLTKLIATKKDRTTTHA